MVIDKALLSCNNPSYTSRHHRLCRNESSNSCTTRCSLFTHVWLSVYACIHIAQTMRVKSSLDIDIVLWSCNNTSQMGRQHRLYRNDSYNSCTTRCSLYTHVWLSVYACIQLCAKHSSAIIAGYLYGASIMHLHFSNESASLAVSKWKLQFVYYTSFTRLSCLVVYLCLYRTLRKVSECNHQAGYR